MAQENEPTGRFQLLSGIVELVGKSQVVQQHVMFRIDTKTGKTWQYVAGKDVDGKMMEFWSPVPEPPR